MWMCVLCFKITYSKTTLTEIPFLCILYTTTNTTDNNHYHNNANHPDSVLHNKKAVSVPDVEKICNYKDLEIEISRMWSTKSRTVPVV